MPTANVNLSAQQAKFIKDAIKRGRFQNASEVVRAGLQLLGTQEEAERIKLAYLRKAAKKGFDELDRGEYEVVTQETLADFMKSISPRRKGRK